MTLRATAAATVFLATAGLAVAQQDGGNEPAVLDTRPATNIFNQMDAGRLTASQYRASEMIGLPVDTENGEQIGEVTDVILDTAAGRIDMIVLETGGFLGLGENRYGIRWSEVAFNRQEFRLTLSMSAEEVRTAPGLRGEGRR